MQERQFRPEGNKERDFWLINGQRDWATVPDGKINGFNGDLPIRLQVGNFGWGKKHIEKRHGHWLAKLGRTLAEVLHEKLGQPGQIYSTEENDKIKIMMRLSPDALLVLRHVRHREYGDFFTVVTLYKQTGHIDGESIGRYDSSFRTES
ncbi:hypothetical protein [Sessilibacter corallicola]|uniref:Phage-Barnase-EndoU-ColicinE5/D-RelE-like nuclease domain-containing protein n=1 Tax=Sessilibacter corallicola TaxID=2904075 RepID=A0ABQ0A5Y8_9GAMM